MPTAQTPVTTGRSHLTELPEEILIKIFTKLDRVSLTRSFRLCHSLHELLTSSPAVSLHHLLLCNSLLLNPNVSTPTSNPLQIPPSSAQLLSILRERLTRFRNFKPRQSNSVTFNEPDGRLYEYLEGILLRGVGGRTALPRELAIYDLRKLNDWEDTTVDGSESLGGESEIETTEEEVQKGLRVTKKFDFEIADFAVDPGMDLLVVVEIKSYEARQYRMYFHLLSLTTFKPHPKAVNPMLSWPVGINRKKVSLCFQICDDGLFVMHHHTPGGTPHDLIYGWQWTTGRLGVTLKAVPTMSFESFILLTPSSLVVPTIITHLDPLSETAEELDNPSDLSWTHHLHLYAFPPFSHSTPSDTSEPHAPPHTATRVAIIDLPKFHVDIAANIPPPRLNIRTDPPPRHQYPTYPEVPNPFHPDPESGVIVMEVFCQLPNDEADPHFAIVVPKKTLIGYLPAPTSPLLLQAFPRPAPVVHWATIASKVRMFGPDLEPQSWVCYVYQNRWINLLSTDDLRSHLMLYDFDPLRVRKEILERQRSHPTSPPSKRRNLTSSSSSSLPLSSTTNTTLGNARSPSTSRGETTVEGDIDGVNLIVSETVLRKTIPLCEEIRTGREMPYMLVRRLTTADVALIDGERVVEVTTGEGGLFGNNEPGQIEVLDF